MIRPLHTTIKRSGYMLPEVIRTSTTYHRFKLAVFGSYLLTVQTQIHGGISAVGLDRPAPCLVAFRKTDALEGKQMVVPKTSSTFT